MDSRTVAEPKQKTEAQLAKQMERRQRARQARKERESNNESARSNSKDHDLKDEDIDVKNKEAIGANSQAGGSHGIQPNASAGYPDPSSVYPEQPTNIKIFRPNHPAHGPLSRARYFTRLHFADPQVASYLPELLYSAMLNETCAYAVENKILIYDSSKTLHDQHVEAAKKEVISNDLRLNALGCKYKVGKLSDAGFEAMAAPNELALVECGNV